MVEIKILDGDEARALNKSIERQRKELAAALGMFSIEFAEMEHWFDESIRHLLGLPRTAGAVLTGAIFSITVKLNIFEALVLGLPMKDETRNSLIAQHEKIKCLNGSRNWLLHNPWHGTFTTGEDLTERHHKTKMNVKTRRLQNKNFSIDEIKKLSENCKNVVRGFSVIFCEIPNNQLSEYT